ncbi:MAG: type VII secretion target [Streptosporangiales bacterium]|jgi:uncharacterized protein YukE|nr:type VII secretion target [Streptosporangiales bacterium]
MGIIGDIENPGQASAGQSGQPEFAPAPSVNGGPAGPAEAAAWQTPPDASGSGQLTVHRDVLRSIASRMHSDVADLDAAVQRVRNAGASLGSFTGWTTGNAFGGNVASACAGFGQIGTHASDTHHEAAKSLTDTASSYDDTEAANSQAIRKLNSGVHPGGI